MRKALALGLACVVGAGSWTAPAPSLAAPLLTVRPLSGPQNAPFEVKVRGLKPGERVTLTADRTGIDGKTWTSSAIVQADRRGEADLATQPSLGGTYEGVSPHGLYCTVLPVAPGKVAQYVADELKTGQPSTLTAPLERSAVVIKASVDGDPVGTAKVWRGFALGKAGEAVSGKSGWRGVYYAPLGRGPVGEPVVVLSGAGGGLFRTTAALLASNGHPVLALGLYNYQDLPKALLRLPLEQVRDGSRWLARKSKTRRVAVWGISRGSEAAQLAAAYFPDDVSAVVAQVPSHLIGGALGAGTTSQDAAWSVGGKPLRPFAGPTFDDAVMTRAANTPPGYRGTIDLLPAFSDPAVEAASGIPYDRIKAPILVLAAGGDDIWPSYVSAEHIRLRMTALHKADQVEVHVYPDAGHGMVYVGRGNAMSNLAYNPALKGYMSVGGTATGDCEASYRAFDDALRFLRRVRARR